MHKELYKKQQKLSLAEFIVGIPKFIIVLLSAIASKSPICFFDTLDSIGYTIDSAYMAFTSSKLRKDVQNKYNYGIEKIEAISSIFCDVLVIIGLLGILIYSIYRTINIEEVSNLILYVIILKVINVLFDAGFTIFQFELKKENNNKITECEFFKSLGALAFDFITLLSLLVSYCLKNYYWASYIPLILGTPVIVYLFIDCIKRMKESLHELTDKTIDKTKQNIISSIINNYHDGYQKVISINTRQVNGQIYVDLVMDFDEDMQYSKIKSLCQMISLDINKEIPNAKVTIKITDKQI